MGSGKWVLKDRVPVVCHDLLEWVHWFENFSNRQVQLTNVGDIRISTVFLSIDHNFSKMGPPLLFESMVFGGALDEAQERYATWDEATAGHERLVKQVKAAL